MLSKKVTLIVSTLSGGGAEGVCVSIANSFALNGWQVDLVILNLKNETYLNQLSNKINLVNLNVNHARYSILPLLKYIYRNETKTILVFNYELTVILVILRSILKLKIKIISRNINTLSIKLKIFNKQNFWTKYIVKPLIKYFYHKSDHVVNQCEAMRKDLVISFPKLYNNSSTIFNPISWHILDYIRKNNLEKINKQNYLLCVGRLENQKAFHFAIEAFAGLTDKFKNLRLKIVGKGSLEKKLRQKAIEFNVENKVDFEGFQKNIIPYYLYAKCTLLTSLYEGYPNVLIESIAMNTPVVSFDCPSGPSEIIKNGVNGFLSKHLDVNDLQNKIISTLEKKFNYRDLKVSVQKNQTDHVFKLYENLINLYS